MVKVRRNELCPCGSGKKHKKCCLSRGITLNNDSGNSGSFIDSRPILIATLTNELLQPMRIYYILHNKSKLIDYFEQLKCMDYNDDLDDWTLLYEAEAANIGLKVRPSKVPKRAQPLIIGTIYIEDEGCMLINVRSIERAAKIIEFINEHIPKTVAEVTHAAIYNKLTIHSSEEEFGNIDYDEIFAQDRVVVIDPEQSIAEQDAIANKYTDKDEALEEIFRWMNEKSKNPLPEVEKFPVHYYEEGIKQFEITCGLRQKIAYEHYKGNKDYSFYNLTQELS